MFTIKYRAYRTLERYKARWVAKGNAQTYGVCECLARLAIADKNS